MKGDRTYIFSAYNSESVYAYGTSGDAVRYCEYLNLNREDIAHYGIEKTDLTPNQLQNTINLADELADCCNQ